MNTGARKNTDRKRKPMTKTNRKADGESEREIRRETNRKGKTMTNKPEIQTERQRDLNR